jgi:hypothetical protein
VRPSHPGDGGHSACLTGGVGLWRQVNAIEEYFELHHIPPPFNAVRLVRAVWNGSIGENKEGSRQRCTRQRSAADVKKLSKDAQLGLLKAWAQQAELASDSQLQLLKREQRNVAEKLDRLTAQLSAAADLATETGPPSLGASLSLACIG